MLEQNVKAQLKTYLERLESPIEIIASLDESNNAAKIANRRNVFFNRKSIIYRYI
jgi:alkyl hydroperoxide reductase subunit AhpF